MNSKLEHAMVHKEKPSDLSADAVSIRPKTVPTYAAYFAADRRRRKSYFRFC